MTPTATPTATPEIVCTGGGKPDSCGICGGDGTSCRECIKDDISEEQVILDSGAKAQEHLNFNVLYKIRKITINKELRRFIRQSKEKAHKLQIRNWTISWVFYTKSNVCTNDTLCVKISQTGLKQEYVQHTNELHNIVLASIRRLEKLQPNARKENRALRARAKAILDRNLATLAKIPEFQSSCS